MSAGTLHKAAVECGWALACGVGVAISTVTQDELRWFTLWAVALVAGWRGFLTVLGMLGIQYPQRPIWTWGRRDGRS